MAGDRENVLGESAGEKFALGAFELGEGGDITLVEFGEFEETAGEAIGEVEFADEVADGHCLRGLLELLIDFVKRLAGEKIDSEGGFLIVEGGSAVMATDIEDGGA